MTSRSPQDVPEFFGLVTETALYGVQVVLTAAVVHILYFSPRSKEENRSTRINWPMLLCSLALFAFSTAHLVVNCRRVFLAFLDRQNPSNILSSLTTPLYTAKYALFFLILILGDMIVIYRCLLVWQKSYWIILIPTVLSIASAILGFMSVYATQHYTSESRIAIYIIDHRESWGTIIFTLSLIANIYATSLIAYRIWSYEHRQMQAQRNPSYRPYRRSFLPVARIILESGALNAAFLIVYTCVLEEFMFAAPIMNAMGAPLVGIIFNLVIVRVAADTKREEAITHGDTTLTNLSFALPPSHSSSRVSTSDACNYGNGAGLDSEPDSELGHMSPECSYAYTKTR